MNYMKTKFMANQNEELTAADKKREHVIEYLIKMVKVN